jgi:hypothetical protein
MSPEIIALIMTTLGGVAAAIKAVAEARKAKFEAQRAELEASRADEAEKTTNAIIHGVEKAKKTLCEQNLGQYLTDEIRGVALERGVEDRLNEMVKSVKKTNRLDKDKLREMLEE